METWLHRADGGCSSGCHWRTFVAAAITARGTAKALLEAKEECFFLSSAF